MTHFQPFNTKKGSNTVSSNNSSAGSGQNNPKQNNPSSSGHSNVTSLQTGQPITNKQPLDDIWFQDQFYVCDETGIYYYKHSDDPKSPNFQHPKAIKIASSPLEPYSIISYEDAENPEGVKYTVVQYRDILGELRYATIHNNENICRNYRIGQNYSIPGKQSDRDKLQDYFIHVRNIYRSKQGFTHPSPNVGLKQIQQEKGVKRIGWDDKTRTFITTRNQRYVGYQMNIFEEAGTEKAFNYHMRNMAMAHPVMSWLLATSVGSFMAPIKGVSQDNTIIYVLSKKEHGKSVTVSKLASIYGAPNKEIPHLMSGASTPKGIAKHLANYTHMFAMVDEIEKPAKIAADNKKCEVANELLTTVGNKQSRVKGVQGGKGQQIDDPVDCYAIGTGNIPLDDPDVFGKYLHHDDVDAFLSRVITIDYTDLDLLRLNPKYSDVEDDESLKHEFRDSIKNELYEDLHEPTLGLQENYGFMFKRIMNYCKENYDQLAEKKKEYANEIQGSHPNLSTRARRLFSEVQVAIDYLHTHFDKDVAKRANEVNEILKEKENNKLANMIDTDYEIYNKVKSFLYMNAQKFVIQGPMYSQTSHGYLDQLDYAEECTKKAQTNNTKNLYGVIESNETMNSPTDFNGRVLLTSVGEDMLAREIGCDMKHVIKSISTIGQLDSSKEGPRKKTRINKKLSPLIGTLGQSKSARLLIINLIPDDDVDYRIEHEEKTQEQTENMASEAISNIENNFGSETDQNPTDNEAEEMDVPDFDNLINNEGNSNFLDD